MVRVVERAIQITTRDFRVQEGLRTREREAGPRLLVADNTAIKDADRITIEAWVNTLSWRTRAVDDHTDEFRIAHVQSSDGWIETTWNNMSDPGAFAVAAAGEQAGGEPPSVAGAGVVVCLMG